MLFVSVESTERERVVCVEMGTHAKLAQDGLDDHAVLVLSERGLDTCERLGQAARVFPQFTCEVPSREEILDSQQAQFPLQARHFRVPTRPTSQPRVKDAG